MEYPNDENGDVLRRMAAHGDDLSKPRDVDFEHVLPSRRAAEEMARQARDRGYRAVVRRSGLLSRSRCVTCTRELTPTHEAITAAEQTLAAIAGGLGGREDGWGCMQQD